MAKTETAGTESLVREVRIAAAPETVFAFFTNPEKLTRWLAAEATLDPRPGGICRQIHDAGGDGGDRDSKLYEMLGEFVEVSPPTRVVFTWGFTNPDVGVPPGTSTVEVTLEPEGGGTRLRLVHRDLPASEVKGHGGGWKQLLGELATVAAAR